MKEDVERGPYPWLAFNTDLPFVRVHDGLHNTESQSIAVAVMPVLRAVKTVKYMR